MDYMPTLSRRSKRHDLLNYVVASLRSTLAHLRLGQKFKKALLKARHQHVKYEQRIWSEHRFQLSSTTKQPQPCRTNTPIQNYTVLGLQVHTGSGPPIRLPEVMLKHTSPPSGISKWLLNSGRNSLYPYFR